MLTLTEQTDAPETVNHPAHYNTGGIECIEAVKAMGMLHGFCVGNAVKYLWRAPHKHETPLEDLKKARFYLDYLIRDIEGGAK